MGEEKHLCEVCGQNEVVGVACVPGVPYSAGYCTECLRANAHPWHILVGQVACIGSLDKVHAEFMYMVECTCKRLNKTMDQFKKDVQASLKKLDEYVDKEKPDEGERSV